MANFDTSKMTKGAAEALELTEANRQETWDAPSFAGELFLGRFREELLWPWPAQKEEDEKFGDELLAKIEEFLKTKVDADAIDREQQIPAEVVRGLAELGLFGMKVPKEYGGLGLSQVNYNRAIALIASHCGSTAVWLSAHQSIGMPQPLKLKGTQEQKEKYLPQYAKGSVSAFALTEPDAGSDPAKMNTTAKPDGQGNWIINGVKLWCTNGLVADNMLVLARTPDKEVKGKMRPQVTAFVVESKAPGFSVEHRCYFMGIRAIQNGQLRFQDVKVPQSAMIGKEGEGLKIALTTLNTGRLTLPAAAAGTTKYCLSVVRRWGNKRIQWGVPVIQHDAIAQKAAWIAAAAFAEEAVTWYASSLADRGGADIRLEAAMAKLFCTRAAWQAIDETMQIRGGRGYETEASLKARGEDSWPVERLMRDTRINRIIEGTDEIMRLSIAREALDPHLKAAGVLANPKAARKAGLVGLAKTLLKAGLFYAPWLGSRFLLPKGLPGAYADYGRLGKHLAWVARESNRLARNLFLLMITNGPALEKRQGVLGRVVDIGNEVFSVACACSYARYLAEKKGRPEAMELAEAWARISRRNVKVLFGGLWCNDDKAQYKLAQAVAAGRYPWMEDGVMPA